MITFLLSGLWHGASWNYVLWGAYHGLLLLATRAHQILRPAAKTKPGARFAVLDGAKIAGMFVLTLVGWLLFRETEFHAIVRDLRLVPWHSTVADRQIGLYLFLLALGYSLPLWAQSLWVERRRGEHPLEEGRWSGAALRALACGLAFAAILVLRSRTSLDFIYFQF
jgi:alginate O-acetyltransferase complex protein AlgI